MGLALFQENQIHDRIYSGVGAGLSLERVVAKVERGTLLFGIHPYGDTMFNIVQIPQLREELKAVAERDPQLLNDVEVLTNILDSAEKARGYIWIEGD